MRFIVYGAGAIGGVIAARLHQAGESVVVIARGDHGAAIRSDGLRLGTPDGDVTLAVPAVEQPAELDLTADDVVVLSMKSQDTEAALAALVAAAPPAGLPIVCAQ